MGYLTLRRAEGPSRRVVPSFFSNLSGRFHRLPFCDGHQLTLSRVRRVQLHTPLNCGSLL
jgi:hypothetical protein